MNLHRLAPALLDYFCPSKMRDGKDPATLMPNMTKALSDESGHDRPIFVFQWLSHLAGDAWLFLGYPDGSYVVFGTDVGVDEPATIEKGTISGACLRTSEGGGFMLGSDELVWLLGCVIAANVSSVDTLIPILVCRSSYERVCVRPWGPTPSTRFAP